jgi:hypothetical protein
MASRVQGTVGTTGNTFPTSLSTSNFGSSVTGGNAILVAVLLDGESSTQAITVTDTQSNAYSRIATVLQSGTDQVDVWLATNVTGGSSFHVTVNSINNTTTAIIAEEWNGISPIAPASTVDQSTTNSASSSSAMSVGPTSATTNAVDVVWLAFGATGSTTTSTTASGFSNPTKEISNPSALFVQSMVTAATGTQSGATTLSASVNWEGIIIAIKTGSPVVPATTPTLMPSNPRTGNAVMRRRAKELYRQYYPMPPAPVPSSHSGFFF